MCFYVNNTICLDPVVTAELGAIPYSRVQIGYGSIGQYLHGSRTWLASPTGSNYKPAVCDEWVQLQTNNVNDKPWLPAVYVFYAFGSPFNRALCENPLRSMKVRINVDCTGGPETAGSTCATMQYAWDCFHGIGGNPDVNGCASQGYDGNGVIDIGAGTFQWDSAIDTKHQQMELRGNGRGNTFLRHSVSTLIRCEWIQC
eukprot:315792_1